MPKMPNPFDKPKSKKAYAYAVRKGPKGGVDTRPTERVTPRKPKVRPMPMPRGPKGDGPKPRPMPMPKGPSKRIQPRPMPLPAGRKNRGFRPRTMPRGKP